MKYTILLFLIFPMGIFSCTGTPREKAPADTGIAMQTACYRYINNKDSVAMNISINDNTVTGELEYYFYEKDSNSGTVRGTIKGDTLFADYSFISEGTGSVREVAFLKKGSNWVEGFGDMKENNGKMIFTDKSTLQFNGNIVLTEVRCTH